MSVTSPKSHSSSQIPIRHGSDLLPSPRGSDSQKLSSLEILERRIRSVGSPPSSSPLDGRRLRVLSPRNGSASSLNGSTSQLSSPKGGVGSRQSSRCASRANSRPPTPPRSREPSEFLYLDALDISALDPRTDYLDRLVRVRKVLESINVRHEESLSKLKGSKEFEIKISEIENPSYFLAAAQVIFNREDLNSQLRSLVTTYNDLIGLDLLERDLQENKKALGVLQSECEELVRPNNTSPNSVENSFADLRDYALLEREGKKLESPQGEEKDFTETKEKIQQRLRISQIWLHLIKFLHEPNSQEIKDIKEKLYEYLDEKHDFSPVLKTSAVHMTSQICEKYREGQDKTSQKTTKVIEKMLGDIGSRMKLFAALKARCETISEKQENSDSGAFEGALTEKKEEFSSGMSHRKRVSSRAEGYGDTNSSLPSNFSSPVYTILQDTIDKALDVLGSHKIFLRAFENLKTQGKSRARTPFGRRK